MTLFLVHEDLLNLEEKQAAQGQMVQSSAFKLFPHLQKKTNNNILNLQGCREDKMRKH